IINSISKGQEKDVIRALRKTMDYLHSCYDVKLVHSRQVYLKDIVSLLKEHFGDVDFHYFFDTSSIRPDGGFLYLMDRDENLLPVLISEVKNQGTNNLRVQEGLERQAKGNAIERLGENVIGLRAALLTESIFHLDWT